MKIARLLLRVTLGGLFIGHGTQKLKGWFGGHGLDATAGMFEQLGLHPGRRNAIASGISETAGGAGLALGLATPFAAASVIGSMFTAIHRVHLKNGPWVTNQGYEYNLVLILAAAIIAELGPGPVSVDHLLGTEKSGAGWGLAALAMGGAGAVVVHQLAQAAAPAEPTSQETVGTPVAAEAAEAAEAPAETTEAPAETAEAPQTAPAQ
jgi:putative oxidoreductase